jgi:hypothetical protein
MYYEAARKRAEPYTKVLEAPPEMRQDNVKVVKKTTGEKWKAYVLVRNRSEGCPLEDSSATERTACWRELSIRAFHVGVDNVSTQTSTLERMVRRWCAITNRHHINTATVSSMQDARLKRSRRLMLVEFSQHYLSVIDFKQANEHKQLKRTNQSHRSLYFGVLRRVSDNMSTLAAQCRFSSRCSIHRYNTGNTINVNTVEEINPPITTVANGRW